MLVREVFAPIQSCFAKLDSLKAGFLREIAADGLLRKRICVTPSLAGQFCKLLLLLRRKVYFHRRSLRVQLRSLNGPGIDAGLRKSAHSCNEVNVNGYPG